MNSSLEQKEAVCFGKARLTRNTLLLMKDIQPSERAEATVT